MPHVARGRDRPELSTYDVTSLPAKTVLGIAKEVESGRGKPCKGWAQVPVGWFEEVGLEVDPDNDPPRHVNVLGWPDEKEDQIQVALEVASLFEERNGRFELRPTDDEG
ncbi:MAG: hypothetical protein AAGK21_13090 [Bacteroidota bacterium]